MKMRGLLSDGRGLSLIEVVISMAMLAILASAAFVWLVGYEQASELDANARTLVDVLRDAQSRSMSGRDFKAWGVYFDQAAGEFILYRDDGSGYAGATVKESNYLSSSIKIGAISLNGGGSQIVFNKPEGDTAEYGTANGNNTAVRIERKNDANAYKNIIVTPLGKIDSQ